MAHQEPKRILIYLYSQDSQADRTKLEETARKIFRKSARIDYSDPTQRNVDISDYDAVLVSTPTLARLGQDSLIANASWGD
jgi:hypothetical protein